MIGGPAVWSNLIFFISALGWISFQPPPEMKTPCQLRAEMESSIRWNEFARPKDEFMVARAGQFTIQIPYKYRFVEPAEPVGLADARTPTHRRARHPAEMEIDRWNETSSWNGNRPLKWNFISGCSWNEIFISTQSWNENSINILVTQRDHFPFHLRASVEELPAFKKTFLQDLLWGLSKQKLVYLFMKTFFLTIDFTNKKISSKHRDWFLVTLIIVVQIWWDLVDGELLMDGQTTVGLWTPPSHTSSS
jgi:hypothetical protein